MSPKVHTLWYVMECNLFTMQKLQFAEVQVLPLDVEDELMLQHMALQSCITTCKSAD